jgi:hypothetical protein
MSCLHLKQISHVCQEQGLNLGQTDLIRLVCSECGHQEVCPANSVFAPENVSTTPQMTFIGLNVHGAGLPADC